MCVDEINTIRESPLIYILLQREMKEAEGVSTERLITVDPTLGIKILPHWLAQPYWRPLTCTRTWDLSQLMVDLIDDILSASQSKEVTA